MGGAETAARQLAEHLRAHTDWEAEVHTTCALDALTWADVLEPGTTEVNGVPVHRHPSAHGRLPDFYGLDGTVRLAPRQDDTGAGRSAGSTTTGPFSPQLVDAVVRVGRRRRRLLPRTSTTPPWRPSARSACRRCCTRRRTTSRRCTCRCSAAPSGTRTPSASTRRRSARSSSGCTRWPNAPRSCSGSAWGSPRARAAPAASSWGWGSVPTSSAWGGSTSTRARRCWRRTSPPTRSAIPDRWPSPWSARSRWSCRRTPTSS